MQLSPVSLAVVSNLSANASFTQGWRFWHAQLPHGLPTNVCICTHVPLPCFSDAGVTGNTVHAVTVTLVASNASYAPDAACQADAASENHKQVYLPHLTLPLLLPR
jgi:hypothetical protein